jgi:hypothetical protein
MLPVKPTTYSLPYFLKNQIFNKSAVMIYAAVINSTAPKLINGNGTKPTAVPKGT